MSSRPKAVPVPSTVWSLGALSEEPVDLLARAPWSRHTPTPWRTLRPLRIAVACDGEDTPKPLAEGLLRDGHRAFWTSRTGLLSCLSEPADRNQSVPPPLDVVVVSARLLGGPDGLELISALYDKCAGGSVVLLGSETARKAALARDLGSSRAFQQVITLESPADVDDLRMIMMNIPARRSRSGFRRGDQ
jgi:hypothetical protein